MLVGKKALLGVLACAIVSGPLATAEAGLAKRRIQVSPGSARLAVRHATPFRFNRLETTPYGPAQADIVLAPSNFLPCRGGPIALCYYSGPEPAPCELTPDGRWANCECFEIPYGPYYVDINAILNLYVYLDTVEACGQDGAGCAAANSAPVCDVINRGELIPGAEMISTFSFACAPEEGLGQTNCPEALYAGCMTAPCWTTPDAAPGTLTCRCPTYDGPFQVGGFEATCPLGGGLVWSAAYNPNEDGTTFPDPPFCVPDAPGGFGCPLLDETTVVPPAAELLCDEVCAEYETCRNADDVEIGYTCDATLCTSTCTDPDLVADGCNGLTECDVTAIVEFELAVGCSCCASQLCGCEPSTATNAAIAKLVAEQEARGIETQCEVNGTLCGD